MATNQVVIYFDKQEDALLFVLAASSVMSDSGHNAVGDFRTNRVIPND